MGTLTIFSVWALLCSIVFLGFTIALFNGASKKFEEANKLRREEGIDTSMMTLVFTIMMFIGIFIAFSPFIYILLNIL